MEPIHKEGKLDVLKASGVLWIECCALSCPQGSVLAQCRCWKEWNSFIGHHQRSGLLMLLRFASQEGGNQLNFCVAVWTLLIWEHCSPSFLSKPKPSSQLWSRPLHAGVGVISLPWKVQYQDEECAAAVCVGESGSIKEVAGIAH